MKTITMPMDEYNSLVQLAQKHMRARSALAEQIVWSIQSRVRSPASRYYRDPELMLSQLVGILDSIAKDNGLPFVLAEELQP